jgi:hypothetical protein
MSHYLFHHAPCDTRFNRECKGEIPARRIPGTVVPGPRLLVLFQYHVDDITGEIGKAESDSDLWVKPTGMVSIQFEYMSNAKRVFTHGKTIFFSGKATVRFLDLEVSGGLKGVETKFSAPHYEGVLSIDGKVDVKANRMEVDYKLL